jgi:L-aspartate oxidase
MTRTCDFLVIGSGLAGLAYALKVADSGHVIILSKTKAPNSNTSMAQGGIAAVMADDDNFDEHIRDTLNAGGGLCHPDVVRAVVEAAPDRVRDLINWGVKFDLTDQKTGAKIDLTREGGHSRRRVLHVQDHTGQDIHDCLLQLARQHKNIEILEDQLAIDLITNRDLRPLSMEPARCLGATAFDRTKNSISEYFARITMFIFIRRTGVARQVTESRWQCAQALELRISNSCNFIRLVFTTHLSGTSLSPKRFVAKAAF